MHTNMFPLAGWAVPLLGRTAVCSGPVRPGGGLGELFIRFASLGMRGGAAAALRRDQGLAAGWEMSSAMKMPAPMTSLD